MADQSDQQLLMRIQRGDRRAYEYLIGRYQTPLFNFTARFLGNADAAADACQQTFIQFFLHAQELRPDEPLGPWLFRVARNRCIDEIRRQHPTPFSQMQANRAAQSGYQSEDDYVDLFADAAPLPEDLAERADLQQILAQAIAALPPKYREVVALRYAADLSFAEIGAILGLPEATVKTQFHRAKPLLRAYLSRYGVTGGRSG